MSASRDTVPLVSVLIPCFNASGAIGSAIRSVIEGVETPIEVVVVDDGSTDGSADVVTRMAEADPRIVLVRSPGNEGVSAARNRGLAAVRGEWLTFLDADDRLRPGAIDAMVVAARIPDTRVVIAQRVWTDGNETWVSRFYDIPDIRVPGRKSLRTHPRLMYYASATGKLLHRSAWEGLAFEGRVLGDQPWTICAMLRAGDRIEVIGDVVYEWWRPPKGRPGTSITSASRSSARSSAAAVIIAADALRRVTAEAVLRLQDPVDQRRIAEVYLERLVRSDLGTYLSGALRRADRTLPKLLRSIGTFLRAVPVDLLDASPAIVDELLIPPLLRPRSILRPRIAYAYLGAAWPVVRARPSVAIRLASTALGMAPAYIRFVGGAALRRVRHRPPAR